MPPRTARCRAAAPAKTAAAASLKKQEQHEHSLAGFDDDESAAAALARECPALLRLIDAQLSRIDKEGTVVQCSCCS